MLTVTSNTGVYKSSTLCSLSIKKDTPDIEKLLNNFKQMTLSVFTYDVILKLQQKHDVLLLF